MRRDHGWSRIDIPVGQRHAVLRTAVEKVRGHDAATAIVDAVERHALGNHSATIIYAISDYATTGVRRDDAV